MNPTSDDDILLARVRRALDTEADRRDVEFEQRLSEVIAAHHRRRFPVSRRSVLMTTGGLALAASLASFFLLPQLFDNTSNDAETAVLVQPGIDPQFLDDMDMVNTLGEDPGQTR